MFIILSRISQRIRLRILPLPRRHRNRAFVQNLLHHVKLRLEIFFDLVLLDVGVTLHMDRPQVFEGAEQLDSGAVGNPVAWAEADFAEVGGGFDEPYGIGLTSGRK